MPSKREELKLYLPSGSPLIPSGPLREVGRGPSLLPMRASVNRKFPPVSPPKKSVMFNRCYIRIMCKLIFLVHSIKEFLCKLNSYSSYITTKQKVFEHNQARVELVMHRGLDHPAFIRRTESGGTGRFRAFGNSAGDDSHAVNRCYIRIMCEFIL
jgi:hypothetical protein